MEIKENERLEMEIENKLAYVLANVYVRIPWNKIGVKSAHKFFIDRIRASSNTSDVKQFMDTLCKKCSVEFVKIDTEYLDFLKSNNNISMNLIRKETLYLTNFALETVEEVKKENKLNKSGQKTLGEQ